MKTTEAKEKICPYALTACFMGAGDALCEADQCMAWRWHHEDTFIGETVEGIKILTSGERMMSKTDGYCGLAGKEGAER